LITGVLFAAIVALAMIGNALRDAGVIEDGAIVELTAKVVFFALTLALFISAIPLMVKFVLAGHMRWGGADRPIIRYLIARERPIILALWGICALGLALALPAAIEGGFFAVSGLGGAPVATMSQGVLVTRPGMSVAEMVRRSTLKLNIGNTVIAHGATFTLQIGDTNVTLAGCRYYFISYAKDDHTRVDMMSIGSSNHSASMLEIDAADASLRKQLGDDGWLEGREVYRDEQSRRLHGGATEGLRGRKWLKGDTVLSIHRRRMDDQMPNEVPGSGEWIQFIELARYATLPWMERWVFAPATR
jgi:hypothetical protein